MRRCRSVSYTHLGTTKDAIDKLRAQGEKVGLLKIRLYRPFPAEAIAEALKNVKAVAVMDRAEGYTNHGGPLGSDAVSYTHLDVYKRQVM